MIGKYTRKLEKVFKKFKYDFLFSKNYWTTERTKLTPQVQKMAQLLLTSAQWKKVSPFRGKISPLGRKTTASSWMRFLENFRLLVCQPSWADLAVARVWLKNKKQRLWVAATCYFVCQLLIQSLFMIGHLLRCTGLVELIQNAIFRVN